MRTMPAAMRQKVLAAADPFAERGLDATTMEDLAATTGVPKATLYYYFESKEDILAFLFTEILDEVANAVADAAKAGGTASERLAAVVAAHLRVFDRFPMASRALQFDLGRAARLPQIAERVDSAFVDPVHDLLVEGAADGSLRTIDHPRLVAIAILGAVAATGINALTVHPRRRVGPVVDSVVEFVLGGVA